MMDSGRDLLEVLEERLRRQGSLQPGDWRRLLALCGSARASTREGALRLLFHPPVADECRHQRECLHFLWRFPDKGRVPPAAMEHLLEWLAFLGSDRGPEMVRLTAGRGLSFRSPVDVKKITERSYPLGPFLGTLTALFSARRPLAGKPEARRSLRLLVRRLVRDGPSRGWKEPTLRDLSAVFFDRYGMKIHRFRKSRWRTVMRPVFLPPADLRCGSRPRAFVPFTRVYWDGFGRLTLALMDALFRKQVQELEAVRKLAVGVSGAVRRVVLSCHNATLGAMGGWAFPSLVEQFPSPSAWEAFRARVDERTGCVAADEGAGEGAGEGLVKALWECWYERLVGPRLAFAVSQERIRDLVGGWEKDFSRGGEGGPEGYRSGGRSPAEPDDPRFAWGGPVAPHQAWSSYALCRWAEERRAGWAAGFRRLRALIRTGQEWLDAGRIDELVLPWIDKFFISSRRDGDIRYLSLLLEWLDGGDTVPVVLFWDDSSRKRSPSLKAALEKLEARRVQGVGVFGRGDVPREDALEAIVRSHHRYRLFALRPWTDTHHPMRLEECLRTRRRTSFVPYDSSWKDNLAFLYSGTQVAAFLSIPYEMESRSPWVELEGKRVPFGVYWRRRLRTEIPGSVCPGADRDLLSQSHAAWANLLDELC